MNNTRSVLSISFAALLLSACQSEEITSPSSHSDLTVREAKAVASGYTPIVIGTLPGDVESYAPSINNFGHVVVSSTYFSSTEPRTGRWFIRAGTQDFILTDGVPYDLSNGATTYVGGTTSDGTYSKPTVWTFNASTGFSTPAVLDYAPGQGGWIQGVGDDGQAVGSAVNGGAVWNADGTRIDVANVDPSLYEAVVPKDINNTNDALFEMFDNDRNHNLVYLRTSDGTMIPLPPLAGHVSSRGSEVSEVVNGVVYVAGTSDDRQGNYRAVRWVVDVATHAIVATHARSDRSSSTGIADDGTVVGDISATGGSTPFVWRTNNTTVTLKAPKGLNSPSAWSISGNGRYISGQAKSGSYGKAVYWVAQQ
jgi:hypothetical protein